MRATLPTKGNKELGQIVNYAWFTITEEINKIKTFFHSLISSITREGSHSARCKGKPNLIRSLCTFKQWILAVNSVAPPPPAQSVNLTTPHINNRLKYSFVNKYGAEDRPKGLQIENNEWFQHQNPTQNLKTSGAREKSLHDDTLTWGQTLKKLFKKVNTPVK